MNPEPLVRGDRVFVRLERALSWLDSWIGRWLPESYNPLAQTGRCANYALIVAVVTGVWLLLWYSPSTQFAYSSLQAIEGRTLGGWVRAMHRYSSDLAMFLVLVHALRMFLSRKFAGARWLPWVSGIGLAVLVWFIGWTGYWLVWDQPAREVAIASMRLLDLIPIFGEPLTRLYVADRLVPSLLFFVVFFTHMLLPLMIAVGLMVHLLRINRARLLPGRGMMLALTLAMAVASLLIPAPLDGPAEMAVKPEAFTVDAWYLTPLAITLRLQGSAPWLLIALAILFAAAIPWIFARRIRKTDTAEALSGQAPTVPWQTFVNQSRCHACTQCVQDCPFDAVHIVPRTDGKPFEGRALVDPARCVGCAVCVGSCDSEAMSLPWFDTVGEENRMLATVEKNKDAQGAVWVAFVAADIDGGWSHIDREKWQQLLPGYHIEAVPTASWVRPKFVEKLLCNGTRGVLVVRDGRNESAARDGNQWVTLRLQGARTPHFRAKRAGDNAESWWVWDFDRSLPELLRKQADAFRLGQSPVPVSPRSAGGWRGWAVGLGLAAIITALVVGPSHLQVANPEPPDPEFVFSFKAFGEIENQFIYDASQDDDRPVHMRGRETRKPTRLPVGVWISVDGEVQEKSFRAKGISRDGPALDQWRFPLQPGPRKVEVRLLKGPTTPIEIWSGTIEALERHLHVLTYEPGSGFRLENGGAYVF